MMNALPGGAGTLNQSEQIINVPNAAKDKFFPEFKRREYEEGNLHKDLVYFSLNQVNPNYTKTLGRDFMSLLSDQKQKDPQISNLILRLLKISLGDCHLSHKDYLSRVEETFINIQKEIKDKEKGFMVAVEVLRKALEREGMSVLYQKRNKMLTASSTKKSWGQMMQSDEVQRLSLLNLHLLAANLAVEYLVLEFKDSEKYSFGALSAESQLREELMHELKKDIIEPAIKKILPENKKEFTVIAARIVHDIHEILPENQEKVFKLCLIIPELDPEILPKVIFSMDQMLKIKYPSIYKSIERAKLIKTLNITEDDWNTWGNREFRETIPMSNTVLVSQLGGRPYFKPSNGWKRFGFEVGCFDLISDNWIKSKNAKPEEGIPEGEWANGYVKFLSFVMIKNSNFFNNTNPIYSSISEAEDVGLNRERFSNKKCGRGVIFSLKIENFLCKGDKKPVLRASPIEVNIEGENKWFLTILQVRVRPEAIRSPKNYDNVYFIVNEPEDIRPIGIMLKEITREEAETYFTA